MRNRIRPMILCLVLWLSCLVGAPTASSLGLEEIGNKPLNAQNYSDWKGIMPVVNDPGRVYRVWVNGNEYFYYQGDTAALNVFLKNFDRVTAPKRIILKKAPPANAVTFRGQSIEFDWQLHIVGGITAGVMAKTQGIKPADFPVEITVLYGSNKIDRNKIVLPKGVRVEEHAIEMRSAPRFSTDLTTTVTRILTQIQTIKPGMTRADLLKVFTTEGGMFYRLHRTYVHKDCPLIKVDVDFKPAGPESDMAREAPSDVITKISKPYLDWMISD